MPEVLLNTDDITIIGPPETVEVLVDIGPQGTRGSQFFVGIGNPNSITLGQTPQLNDVYINKASGSNLGYLYQYVSQPGGNTWIPFMNINPAIYSKKHVVSFTSGSGTITIPISSIVTVSGTPPTSSNFNIFYSIAHSNPVSSAMTVPTLSGSGTDLVINIKAVESNSGTWQNLSGEVTIHTFISFVV